MLKETLEILNKNKVFSNSILSNSLNISIEMAEDLIAQLTRMGYIKKDEATTCSSVCSSCAYASNCSKEVVKYYQLTDKAKDYLN